jgi:hypothetical protein
MIMSYDFFRVPPLGRLKDFSLRAIDFPFDFCLPADRLVSSLDHRIVRLLG